MSNGFGGLPSYLLPPHSSNIHRVLLTHLEAQFPLLFLEPGQPTLENSMSPAAISYLTDRRLNMFPGAIIWSLFYSFAPVLTLYLAPVSLSFCLNYVLKTY